MCWKVRARLRKRGPWRGKAPCPEDGSGADPELSSVSRTKAHRRPDLDTQRAGPRCDTRGAARVRSEMSSLTLHMFGDVGPTTDISDLKNIQVFPQTGIFGKG